MNVLAIIGIGIACFLIMADAIGWREAFKRIQNMFGI